MIRRSLTLLLFATSLNAQTAISTITPAAGNVNGGEYVHIHGTHLLGPLLPCVPFPTTPTCSTFVKFGGVLGQLVTVTDEEIVVMTPPHAAGAVDVEVNVPQNADITVNNGYRYDDPLPSDNVRFLVPVVINTAGAFGSNWTSELSVTNSNADAVTIAGTIVAPGTTAILTPPSSTTGTFIAVPRRVAGNVTMSLHVRDTSRSADSFGTDVPVVPETQFRPMVVLSGIPTDARFRTLLRIYGYDGVFAHVTVTLRDDGTGTPLSTQTIDMSDYGQLALGGGGATRVRAEISATPIGAPAFPAPPLWAFVSVTNNSTQEVTTITPSMNATSASPALAIGRWAGGGACVTVSATDVQVQGACFSAAFPRPIVNQGGEFRAEGTILTTGGAAPINPPTGVPALFGGIVNGSDLTLTISTTTGTFTVHLTLGSTAQCPQACP